jgi:hypothetical protein
MNARAKSRSVGCTDLGTIERALELLRLLATAGRYGLALTQVSGETGLPHSTVHRLLHRPNAWPCSGNRTSATYWVR